MDDRKIWTPHPGPQTTAFGMFLVDELLYGGAKGGGKTDWLLFDFADDELIKLPHYRGVIFRRTYTRLLEIVDRAHKWFSPWATYNKTDHCWTFKSGAKLYFRHCQNEEDKYDYQGHEYHYMGFDQLEEFNLTQFEYLCAQCRTTDKKIKIRIRATANPGNRGHGWVKARFIDGKKPGQVYKNKLGLTSAYVPAKVYDNPSLLENDPQYIARLKSLPEKERLALLEGDWDIFAGQYFSEWNPALHIVERCDFSQPHTKFFALDYGFSSFSSVGWYAVFHEHIVRYRELYVSGSTYETLARQIIELSGNEKFEYGVCDPAIWGDKSHHISKPQQDGVEFKGESGGETMQKVFGSWVYLMRGDNSRKIGWGRVRHYLKPYKDQFNEWSAKFLCVKQCKNLIRTLPGLVHDDNDPEDLDTLGEDHAADELRLALMSRPVEPTIPKADATPAEHFWERVNKDVSKYHERKFGTDGLERDLVPEGARAI